MMTTMTTPANVSDQLMGLYGPEQLREVERLSTYNYRARLAGGEIVLAVVRGDGSLALIEPGDGRMMGYKKSRTARSNRPGQLTKRFVNHENICIIPREHVFDKGGLG